MKFRNNPYPWLLLLALVVFVASVHAEQDLVACYSDTSCEVKIYRSDAPVIFASYPIAAESEVPVPAGNQVTITYNGSTGLITCNDTWQVLPGDVGTYADQIRCRVSDDRTTLGVDLEVYDQMSLVNVYQEQPSQVGYPELSGTSEASGYCESETLADTATACKWEAAADGGWAVYARTTVQDLTLGFGMPEGEPAMELTDWCGEDANGNGSFDEGEAGLCVETDTGLLCLHDSVECSTASPEPICPEGGALNPVTDKCEHAPEYPCPENMVWDSILGMCVNWSNCGNICPVGYVYNTSENLCISNPCSSGAEYNPQTNRCELLATYRCPIDGALNNDLGMCNAACSQPGVCIENELYNDEFLRLYTEFWWDRCNPGREDMPNTGGFDFGLSDDEITELMWDLYDGRIKIEKYACGNESEYCCVGVFFDPNGDGGRYEDVDFSDYHITYTYRSPTPDNDGNYHYSILIGKRTYLGDSWRCSSTGVQFASEADCQANCTITQGCTAICPEGFTDNGGLCITAPICEAGGILTTATGRCELAPDFSEPDCSIVPDPVCNDGYSFVPTTGLCEVDPICEAGSYDPATDECPTGFLCPYGPQYPCHTYEGQTRCSPYECYEIQDGQIINNGTAEGANDKDDDGELDPETGECTGQIYIFNGEDMRCRNDGITIGWGNCCQDEKYVFDMLQCEEREILLAQKKQRGLCHRIGEYCSQELDLVFTSICIEYKTSYCCFNSKLGRIIQEQGRNQLSTLDWGTAESPNCRGMEPEELQMLDWNEINLDEYRGDIETKTQQQLGTEMIDSVQDAQQGSWQ